MVESEVGERTCDNCHDTYFVGSDKYCNTCLKQNKLPGVQQYYNGKNKLRGKMIPIITDEVKCPNCKRSFFVTVHDGDNKNYTSCPHCHIEMMMRVKIEVKIL